MKQKKKALAIPPSFVHSDEDEEANNPLTSPSEGEPQRRKQRELRQPANSNDFIVELLEFEGKLGPNEFLEWLHIVEWIFDCKELPKDKKVKLVALKLIRCVSAERVRKKERSKHGRK